MAACNHGTNVKIHDGALLARQVFRRASNRACPAGFARVRTTDLSPAATYQSLNVNCNYITEITSCATLILHFINLTSNIRPCSRLLINTIPLYIRNLNNIHLESFSINHTCNPDTRSK